MPDESPRGVLTGRVIAWFVLLMGTIVVWTEYSTLVVNSTSFNSLAPSIALVFVLAVFAGLVNPLLTRLAPGKALSGREQILLYIMLSIASPLSSIGLVHFIFSVVMAPGYHATPENHWDLFINSYPRWFGILDAQQALHFWEGSADGVPWDWWLRPLVAWSVFVLALNLGMYCLVVLVHQQWIRNERLTFPLVYLPLELTAVEQDHAYSKIWRDSTFWIGFTIAIVPHLFCGLHTYFPAVPELPFKGVINLTRDVAPPWRHLGAMPINFYPGMIGFASLLPLDVSFSVWVFFVIERFLTMFGTVSGLTAATSGGSTSFPFSPEQSVGAWLALTGTALWMARHHLRSVLLGSDHTTPEDVRLHRQAFAGFVLCLVILTAWRKMADAVHAPIRSVTWGVIVATVLTMIFATYVTLNVIYQHGAIALNAWRFSQVPRDAFNMLVSWIQVPRERDWLRVQAVLFGAGALVALATLRMKVLWWPFHPIGYAVGFTKRTVPWIWFSFLFGWLLKGITLKVGGHKWHQRLPALCLGLILGDFFMAGIFGVVGALVPQAGYQAFP